MKKTVKIFVFSTLLFFCATVSQNSKAQPPPPPPAEKGSNENQTPSEAPIGNGTFMLLTLAMAYAGRKVYVVRAIPTGE